MVRPGRSWFNTESYSNEYVKKYHLCEIFFHLLVKIYTFLIVSPFSQNLPLKRQQISERHDSERTPFQIPRRKSVRPVILKNECGYVRLLWFDIKTEIISGGTCFLSHFFLGYPVPQHQVIGLAAFKTSIFRPVSTHSPIAADILDHRTILCHQKDL